MEAAAKERHIVKVLVVDDSPTARLMLCRMLETDPEISVVGMAGNGREAVEQVARLKPDLVTMDVEMPVMDGIMAIEQIMAYTPVPVLVLSSVVAPSETANAARALGAGAVDVVSKPESTDPQALDAAAEILRSKVKLMSRVRVITHPRGRLTQLTAAQLPGRLQAAIEIVAVASSTGGPQALQVVLGSLSADFHAGVVIVQHITEGFTDGLVEWLGHNCRLAVRKGKHGDLVRPGEVIVAPDAIHMTVTRQRRIALVDRQADSPHKPSADILLESVADAYGSGAMGVILTGMGRDGARGMKAIHDRGGHTLAQDAETSVIYGMAREAVNLGAVDSVLPLPEIGRTVQSLAGAREHRER